MNLICFIKNKITDLIKDYFTVESTAIKDLEIHLNVDKNESFGDLSCNAALILAKTLKQNPRVIASKLKEALETTSDLKDFIESVDIAGPGFINIHLQKSVWQETINDLMLKKDECFVCNEDEKKENYLLEFVSANPTGPLHLGHGRGGIIGDVLAKILNFLGHKTTTEFYINDAGNQMQKLGQSLKIRCQQELGEDIEIPEGGYAGEYMIGLAKECIKEYGNDVLTKPLGFLTEFAMTRLLNLQKKDLGDYGIIFDRWFSEKTLHEDGSVESAIKLLQEKKLVYEKDDALWFKSSEFGDDKDRVIKKQDGALTYIASDIAYHKNKFDRGFTKLIDIMGQDHHGYIKRLKATMDAVGYNSDDLNVILYQLVTIKKAGEAIRMSKRAGTFTTLRDIIDEVGVDVARFFYLNRKADAHLDFDLEIALKKTDENPVYYAQYAYVRTGSLLQKAQEIPELVEYVQGLDKGLYNKEITNSLCIDEIELLRKIISLEGILYSISKTHQTHVLTYYTLELAKSFHNYYGKKRIIDANNIEATKLRLLLVALTRQTLALCFDLLGISKPSRM